MAQRTLFGLWLKRRRKELGLSQKDLARAADCSIVTIAKIEAGERKPSRQIAELLAQFFGIETGDRAAFVEFARAGWIYDQARLLTEAGDKAPWRTLHTLRTLEHLQRRPNNLPAQRTSFVGREEVVAAVCSTLRVKAARLASITGPPGIGKTRLSLRVATELLEEYRDGVFFVPLASAPNGDLVASTIEQALKVRESTDRPASEGLKQYLHGRHMLLILDNFEHVMAAAPLVSELLVAAAGLTIIVTSREPLHVYGEHVVQVPPLTLPGVRVAPSLEQAARYEAIRLFTDRAVAVKRDFAITGENARTVTEICRRIDSLPLAIELAAARVNVLSLSTILQRLDDRLQLLAHGPHDLPPRQQTIRAAIDWSYNLLIPGEQRLFRQLSVFPGKWKVETAQAVLEGDEASIAHGVESLLSKNLLRQEGGATGEQWFSMLETIRAYASEKLLESGEGQMRQMHAAYYLSLSEEASPQLNGAEQSAWLQRLEMEHDNLLGALSYSTEREDTETVLRMGIALWRFWDLRGHPREGLRWLLEGLAAATASNANVPVSLLGNAFNSAGNLAWTTGDYALARRMHEHGLALRRQLGDKLRIASSLNNLGLVAQDVGDYEQARALYEESLQICRELDDKADIASTLNNLGITILALGDHDMAASLGEESLSLWQELEDAFGIALSFNNLGEVARSRQDFVAAGPLYEQALTLYRELGYRQGVAYALNNLGLVAYHRQEIERAASLFREGLSILGEEGDMRAIVESLFAIAGVALSQGEARRAVRLLGSAAAALEASGVPLYPLDHREYDRILSASRLQLKGQAWQVAWDEGQAMPVEHAIAYALEELSQPEEQS
jgi:predicted ATPase/transcriptional regulator with XRE-family HTH domain